MIYEPYKELGAAIILQAVKDYRTATRKYRKGKDTEKHQATMNEIESFIRSEWFGVLSDIEPEMLLNRLREEII